MSRFVLDCSVAMAWCFENHRDRYSGAALRDARELLALGREYGLSAYDAAYLHLAVREGLPLATRDGALRSAMRLAGVSAFAP